jgi:hypothetical protein
LENQLNKKDLKIQALLERISSDKVKYEDEIANLRVDYTIVNKDNEILLARINELEAPDVQEKNDSTE